MIGDNEGLAYAHSIVAEIHRQGGLINWADLGCRLGFFELPADCMEDVIDLVTVFEEHKFPKVVGYLQDEVIKFKANLLED